jgi:hypothetical protein
MELELLGDETAELSPEQLVLQRVLESSAFARSSKLKSFLIYVTERALAGRTEEITEQQIGVAVFGRRGDYSPGEDSIVRSQARLLRAKLDLYFEGDGSIEPLRIVIPKGSYIPLFERRKSELEISGNGEIAFPANTMQATMPCLSQSSGKIDRYLWIFLLLAFSGLAASVAQKHWQATAYERRPTHVFWTKVFDTARPTLIVTTDSGLAMQDDLTHHGVTLDQYMTGKSRETLEAGAREDATEVQLAGRRYVTLVDLRVTEQFLRLPEAIRSNTEVAFARDLKIDDVRRSNLVLLGARASNPWLDLFWNDLDFVIDRDFVTHDATILNRRPRNGEPESYHYMPREPARIYYCAIAFEPARMNAGSHLLIQGTSMVGVQMCATTLFDDSRWKQILSSVGTDGSPRGFELLMRSGGPENGTASSQILALHVH